MTELRSQLRSLGYVVKFLSDHFAILNLKELISSSRKLKR